MISIKTDHRIHAPCSPGLAFSSSLLTCTPIHTQKGRGGGGGWGHLHHDPRQGTLCAAWQRRHTVERREGRHTGCSICVDQNCSDSNSHSLWETLSLLVRSVSRYIWNRAQRVSSSQHSTGTADGLMARPLAGPFTLPLCSPSLQVPTILQRFKHRAYFQLRPSDNDRFQSAQEPLEPLEAARGV